MKEIFTQQVKIDNEHGWCAGLGYEYVGESPSYWHSGINPGMQSLFVLIPDKKEAYIVMTNSDKGLDFAQNYLREEENIKGEWKIPRTKLSRNH